MSDDLYHLSWLNNFHFPWKRALLFLIVIRASPRQISTNARISWRSLNYYTLYMYIVLPRERLCNHTAAKYDMLMPYDYRMAWGDVLIQRPKDKTEFDVTPHSYTRSPSRCYKTCYNTTLIILGHWTCKCLQTYRIRTHWHQHIVTYWLHIQSDIFTDQHWLRYWRVACSTPNHFLIWCWLFIN